jgi:hypothetical protein
VTLFHPHNREYEDNMFLTVSTRTTTSKYALSHYGEKGSK